MLPGLDGVQVAQRIRQTANTPIIMLTAKSDTTDVVKGLEAGADDYVVKPFEVVELMARIKARLRTLGWALHRMERQPNCRNSCIVGYSR